MPADICGCFVSVDTELPFYFLDINKPPIANAGPDVTVHLPNRAAELDGSSSYDDHGIVMYEWSRDPKSPAAGVSVN